MNSLGQAAEQAALEYLQRQGLRLIVRNWSCKLGEIDLIMQDGRALVFIEVRSRRNPRFGGAAGSINSAKQAKLVRTAQCYLQSMTTLPLCRFDAVCIDGEHLQWLKDCIQAD
ncbi:YraN family protein [Deefgea salmonis]|uniref:UPF0102 protein LG219_07720 n=1 Tax=Deefgea salmonis TaxID=2875502 RepID=A0ABS8BKM9_9NEIS|nr:YraN family protein [Deefgea salmonis]MCB5196169.1 YraN family protein [Deefgea salmonis]